MIDLLLASGNKHKAEEFAELFDKSHFKIASSVETLDVEESGATYHENAFIKAKAYYDKFKLPVFADDSGLNVDYLPNELGVFSARFGGGALDQNGKINLLLKKLEGVHGEKRSAYFTCVLCFYFSHEKVFFFEGEVHGSIALTPRGEDGFGYDPVFLPKELSGEKTLAEVPLWKNFNSHRARAVTAAQKFLIESIN